MIILFGIPILALIMLAVVYVVVQDETAQPKGRADTANDGILSRRINTLQTELEVIRAQYAVMLAGSNQAQSVSKASALDQAQEDSLAQLKNEISDFKTQFVLLQQAWVSVKNKDAVLESQLADQKQEHLSLADELRRVTGLVSQNNGSHDAAQISALAKDIGDIKDRYAQIQQAIGASLGREALAAAELEKVKAEFDDLRSRYIDMSRNAVLPTAKEAHISHRLDSERQQRIKLKHAMEQLAKEVNTKIARLHGNLKKYSSLSHAARPSRKAASVSLKPREPDFIMDLSAGVGLEPTNIRLDRSIAAFLLDKGVIDQSKFDDAFTCHYRFGGKMTQYLTAFDYVRETDMAAFISARFAIPYSSIKQHQISSQLIKMLPLELVRQYCLFPLGHKGNWLNLLMADPMDAAAIKNIEKVTGCRIQPFMGTVSDILAGVQEHYRPTASANKIAAVRSDQIFAGSQQNRRFAMRLSAAIDIELAGEVAPSQYKTKNISPFVMMFESKSSFALGSSLGLKVNLPPEFYSGQLASSAQVVRVVPLKKDLFEVGIRHTHIAKPAMMGLMEYAKKLSYAASVPAK